MQREIEKASPQICGADEELWREFIKRDIHNWEETLVEPKNPRNWYKVYRKLRTEGELQVDKDAETLKAAMEGIKSERAKHTSKVIDSRTAPRLPRGGRVRAGQNHTGNTAVLSFASGSKTKILTGKGVLDKARREARELSLFSARNGRLGTPTHKLNNKATQIHHVPRGLLEEHRRPPPPEYVIPGPKPTTIIAPRKRTLTAGTGAAVGVTNEEREKRLRAFTTPGNNRQDPIAASFSSSQPQNTSISSASAQNNDQIPPQISYSAPRPRISSPSKLGLRPVKAKAPVDPFMPAKRRRIS